MIVPWINKVLLFKNAPLTWVLILIQLSCFFLSQGLSFEAPLETLSEQQKMEFLDQQGQVYASYLKSGKKPTDSRLLLSLADLVQQGSEERSKLLGSLSLRDTDFLAKAPEYT